LLLIVALLIIIDAKFLFPLTRIPNVSAVETENTVGVYWDTQCENKVYSLNWGNLSPGTSRKINVYVRNECNRTLTLDILTEKWLPLIAAQDISLSWDYPGCPIGKNQVLVTELELSVSPEIEGITNFSFDTVIESEEIGFSLGGWWMKRF
jgi:hypothetical protein